MHERMAGRRFPEPHASAQYTPDTHQAIRACYAAMIENIDVHLGRYVDYLATRGVFGRDDHRLRLRPR